MPSPLPLLLRFCFRGAPAGAVIAALAAPVHAISGVCPDGSIFIVQRADAIPCRGARAVDDPSDIPPINPEFLPRPYGWEVFNRETDPNNPYNLLDGARPDGGRDAPPGLSPEPSTAVGFAPPAPPPPPAPAGGLALGLSAQDLADLRAIIEISQDRAPATFVLRDVDGAGGLTLRMAHSAAFGARVATALTARNGASRAGPVVAFLVEASAPDAFYGNFTFVQGHMAYHPDPEAAGEFGVLEGALGPMGAGEHVIGYAVLPPALDLDQPIDVYWNDQLFTAQLKAGPS